MLTSQAPSIWTTSPSTSRSTSSANLCFAMNAWPLLHASLPRVAAGFYSKCYYTMRVSAPAGNVSGSSSSDVVKIINDGKKRMPSDYGRWATGEAGANGSEDPYQITNAGCRPETHSTLLNLQDQVGHSHAHNVLDEMKSRGGQERRAPRFKLTLVSHWRRLGFAEVSYGGHELCDTGAVGDGIAAAEAGASEVPVRERLDDVERLDECHLGKVPSSQDRRSVPARVGSAGITNRWVNRSTDLAAAIVS